LRLVSRSGARSAARPSTTSCGSRLPRPYHFRARIQSFQAVAAPFPGDPTPELLFDGCGISRVAVKTNNSSINLEFLAPRGCCGARRVSRARWIGISEPTSSDASTYLVFPKEKSRKDRRRRFREIPPSRAPPKTTESGGSRSRSSWITVTLSHPLYIGRSKIFDSAFIINAMGG